MGPSLHDLAIGSRFLELTPRPRGRGLDWTLGKSISMYHRVPWGREEITYKYLQTTQLIRVDIQALEDLQLNKKTKRLEVDLLPLSFGGVSTIED